MLWRCSANAFPTSSPLGLLVDMAAELQTWHGHAEGHGRPRPLRPTGLRASQSLGPWASAGRVRNRPLPPAAFRFDGRSGTEERWGGDGLFRRWCHVSWVSTWGRWGSSQHDRALHCELKCEQAEEKGGGADVHPADFGVGGGLFSRTQRRTTIKDFKTDKLALTKTRRFC